MLAKSNVHGSVAPGNRLRAHLDHDEVARRHLAQAQLHIDIALSAMESVIPKGEAVGERIAAHVAISELYRALNRSTRRAGEKRGRR